MCNIYLYCFLTPYLVDCCGTGLDLYSHVGHLNGFLKRFASERIFQGRINLEALMYTVLQKFRSYLIDDALCHRYKNIMVLATELTAVNWGEPYETYI